MNGQINFNSDIHYLFYYFFTQKCICLSTFYVKHIYNKVHDRKSSNNGSQIGPHQTYENNFNMQ